jgi:alpha-galactosidase
MSVSVAIGDRSLALVLTLPEYGMPEIVAFGSGADGAEGLGERASRTNGMDQAVASAVILPVGGMGFFGWPAIAGHRGGQDFVIQFSSWAVERTTHQCALFAEDKVAGLAIEIRLSICNAVMTSAVVLTNRGDGVFTLDRCMAGSMVFPEGHAYLTNFTGMWGREFQLRREPVPAGLWLRENRRGRSSHDCPPSLIVASPDASLAMHFGWSGNFLLAVDRLDDGRRLVHAGELFEPGEMRLGPNESYASPTVYFAPDLSDLRAFARASMAWPGGKMGARPVTLNTWEGTYFNHRLPQLLAQVDVAADVGIERFVLDDGWFGRRDSDASSLGDWIVDRRKYPQGLQELADRVRARGMEFGLWFEPEMVSPDSDLFRTHPDWVLKVEGRRQLLSRHQLVLDLTRPHVSHYLFERLAEILSETAIDYIKWDMNRDLTHVGGSDGRAATSRQTHAVYALMDRMRAAYPHVEIESCASGGGRADYGVLTRTHRLWTSDCTDPLDRLEIQRGARMFFPPEILGAHVSASPNHQTHRQHTLAFRAIVALAYHFGVELDLLTLQPTERAELKDWIALHKRLRPILHAGHGQFHLEPFDGRYAWGAVGKTGLVVIIAQGPTMMTEQPPPLRLPVEYVAEGRWRIIGTHPLTPDFIRISSAQMRLLAGEITFLSQTLTRTGLSLPMLRPQSGLVLEIERVAGH